EGLAYRDAEFPQRSVARAKALELTFGVCPERRIRETSDESGEGSRRLRIVAGVSQDDRFVEETILEGQRRAGIGSANLGRLARFRLHNVAAICRPGGIAGRRCRRRT